MEYWSVGVLRPVRIAPRDRGVEGAHKAERYDLGNAVLFDT